MDINQQGTFRYSNENTKVHWVKNVENYQVDQQAIVVNLGISDALFYANKESAAFKENPKSLKQWESAILKGVTVQSAELILVVEYSGLNIPNFSSKSLGLFPALKDDSLQNSLVNNELIREEVIDDQWEYAGDLYPSVQGMPLWKTKEELIDEIGTIRFDPYYASRQSSEYKKEREVDFKVKVYLWFSFQQSNCGIHNNHKYIEIHTQIAGTGRIPKYLEQDVSTCYEEHRMAPGATLPQAFCLISENKDMPGGIDFTYPWHQYFADTDCVWIVTEFHPAQSTI